MAKLERLARAKGELPYMRLTAAFSDGARLFAVRYATDAHAPTLYHRWNAQLGGRAVVSEPLEADGGWQRIDSGRLCIFEGERVTELAFSPEAALAAA